MASGNRGEGNEMSRAEPESTAVMETSDPVQLRSLSVPVSVTEVGGEEGGGGAGVSG